MAQKQNTLHIRVDDDLLAEVEGVVQRTGARRSQVVRSLLRQALGNDNSRTSVEEALFDFAQIRRVLMQRLGTEIGERLPKIMDEVLAGAAAE